MRSKINIPMIESYIQNTINSSVKINPDNFPYEEWKNNKLSLYHLMRQNLILEKEVEIQKDYATLEEEMIQLANDSSFYCKLCKNLRKVESLNDYFYISYHSLLENRVSWRTMEWLDPNYSHKKPIKIQCGMKMLKLIKQLAEYYDMPEEEYEEFRLEHSRLLNEKTLKGTLCLSIHPLDFFTMSDNECGWESCMSWREDGCYKIGTLEMMNSPYVLVAYLKSKSTEMEWGEYTWNSKKWRTLIMVDNNIIVSNKNYPYQNEELTTLSLNWVRELAQENWNIPYDDKIRVIEFPDGEENYTNEGEIIGIPNTFVSFSTEQMYNDMYHDKLCIVSQKFYEEPFDYTMNYSGVATCAACGSSEPMHDGQVICNECAGLKECAHCGRWTHKDNLNEDGTCEYCSDRYERQKCAICGNSSYDGNILVRYVLKSEQFYPYACRDFYVCEHHYDKYRKLFNQYCEVDLTNDGIIEEITNNFDFYRDFFTIFMKTADIPNEYENLPIVLKIKEMLNN